jgi:peroxiredoxin
MNDNFAELPSDLPVPLDDGAAAHLKGMTLVKISLPSTDGATVDLSSLTGLCVIYIYPMTGRPGVPLPDGWDAIPGARGCTPQSCNFRDHYTQLKTLGSGVFGASTQDSEYQREVRDRLNLPFQLLSDSSLRLKSALRLPTFHVNGLELYKRLTLIVDRGKIEKVFYPVFPPDKNAEEVLNWLKQHASSRRSREIE